MTSRERVLAALNHREPDRVPIDFSGHRSSGISAIVYPRLRKLLGLPSRPVRIYDLIQQLAIVDEDVLNLFGVDTIELGRAHAFLDRIVEIHLASLDRFLEAVGEEIDVILFGADVVSPSSS